MLRGLRHRYPNSLLQKLVKEMPKIGALIDAFLHDAAHEFRLIDKRFLDSQRRIERVNAFGSPIGDWSMIVNGHTIPRDIEADLLSLLLETSNEPRLMIILGSPGEGKTTLLRRLGYQLAQKKRTVYELPATQRDDWRSHLDTLSGRKERPFLLLDNLFRLPDIANFFEEPLTGLTIIATSRKNEEQNLLTSWQRLSPDDNWPTLDPPSQRELDALRAREPFDTMPEDVWSRVTSNSSFLSVMIQCAGKGKPFAAIIRDTVQRLRNESKELYDLLGIVALLHSRGLLVPSSVLGPLTGLDRADELIMKGIRPQSGPGAQGLLFMEKWHGDVYWRTDHEEIARVIADCIYGDELQLPLIVNLVEKSDPTRHSEFVSRVFLALHRNMEIALLDKLMETCRDHLCKLHEIRPFHWAIVYDTIGETESAKKLLDTRSPRTLREAHIALDLCTEHDRGNIVLERMRLWPSEITQVATVRLRHLRLVRKYGTQLQVEAAIAETRIWLLANEMNVRVFWRYLSLVEEYGTQRQTEEAIALTSKWLSKNEHDTHVRQRYLSLVEKYGTQQQVEAAIDETSHWLRKNEQDTLFRQRYLIFVGRYGTQQQVEAAIAETSNWLSRNEQDTRIRRRYLMLVKQIGTLQQQEKVLPDTVQWLKHNPDLSVMNKALRLAMRISYLQRLSNPKIQISNSTVSLVELASANADEIGPFSYCALAYLLQNEQDPDETVQLYQRAVDNGTRSARLRLGTFLLDQGDYELAESVLRPLCEGNRSLFASIARAEALIGLGKISCAEKCIPSHERVSQETLYDMGKYYRRLHRYEKAEKAFRDSLSKDPSYFWPYVGLAKLANDRGDRRSAETHLVEALRMIPTEHWEGRRRVERECLWMLGYVPELSTDR